MFPFCAEPTNQNATHIYSLIYRPNRSQIGNKFKEHHIIQPTIVIRHPYPT